MAGGRARRDALRVGRHQRRHQRQDTVDAARTAAAPSTTIDPVAKALSDGAVAVCRDGRFSDNTDFGATCSGGDGVDRWLTPYGECVDGTVIGMSEDASCEEHGGFRRLLAPDYRPTPRPGDLAKCGNGVADILRCRSGPQRPSRPHLRDRRHHRQGELILELGPVFPNGIAFLADGTLV
jgi:hypothetical protein